jgi:hypothetical protein
MNEYFLGVDGGQSSTTALIGARGGRVLGMGRGGPSNHVGGAEGRPKFINAIQECLTAASLEAGLNASTIHFAAACLGFSGGPADKDTILREIVSSERTIVTHDALIALAGATAGQPGLITIAAPVFRFDGTVVAAVSVSAPTSRMKRETAMAVARRCVEEAAGLSSALGYRPRARKGA